MMPAVRLARRIVPLLALAACAPPPPPLPPAAPAAEGRRAILVSLDALNEHRATTSLPGTAIPALRDLFESAACAASAIPAFPSVTAAGHASLWTGAYGDVSGVSANAQPQLPRDRHTLLDLASGFSARALRAEPIWITAARQGVAVAGHHVTQGPQPPGYVPVRDAQDAAALAARRAEAEAALRRPGVLVVNGYNRTVAPDRVLTERTAPARPARGWRGLESLPAGGVAPLEVAWRVGKDSVYALLHGADRYTHVLLAAERDVRRGVVVAASPADTTDPRGRELARFFSDPLFLRAGEDLVAVRVRAFQLARDASRYLLFQPEVAVVEASDRRVGEAYLRAIGGWVGNGALRLLRNGAFGRPLVEGGDGTAEARYLETAELVTRQFMRGSAWIARELRPRLQLEYFPIGDEVDHAFYGLLEPRAPGYDPSIAAGAQEVRGRAWALVDLRLAHLRRLAEEGTGGALFVSGDHGMRATWGVFRPNAALREAGLLELNERGRIVPARSRALSPNGYWVSVNRAEWKAGTVPPAEEAEVLRAAEAALLAVRDSTGGAVVTRVWRAAEAEGLGLGGAVGGDLYYELAAGYRWSADPRGPVTEPAESDGGHGFPSVAPDMHTVFCAQGPRFEGRRIPTVRIIDVAPTLAEWLGIDPPADARGGSVLPRLLHGGAPTR